MGAKQEYRHYENNKERLGNLGQLFENCDDCKVIPLYTGGKKMSRNGPYVYQCLCKGYLVKDDRSGEISTSWTLEEDDEK